jgi:hypothetical protein
LPAAIFGETAISHDSFFEASSGTAFYFGVLGRA